MPTEPRQRVVRSGGVANAIPPRRSSGGPVALPRVQAIRRQRIIDVALQMLRDSKGENVEIRDVAQQVGLALGTVYRYVGSKERLLAEVYRAWWAEKSDPIARRLAKGTTNSDRLRRAATG